MKVIDEFTTTSLDNNNNTTTTSLDSNSTIALKNNKAQSIYEIRNYIQASTSDAIGVFVFLFIIFIFLVAVGLPEIALIILVIFTILFYGMTTRYIHSLNIDYENLKKKRKKKCDEGGKDGDGKPIWSVACKRANRVNQHFSNWNNIRFSPREKRILFQNDIRISPEEIISNNSINKKEPGIIKFTRGLKDIELTDYNDNDEKYKNYKDPGNIFIIILNGIFPIIFLFTCWYYIYEYRNLYYTDAARMLAFIRKKNRFRILLGIVSVLFLFFNTFIPAKIINDYKMQKKTLGEQIILIKSKHKELKKGTTTSSIDNNDKNIKDTSLDNNIEEIENQLDTYKRDLPHLNIVKLAKMQITFGIVSVVYMLFVENHIWWHIYKLYKNYN